MKGRAYCYRLKGVDKVIPFKLEDHSEAHILFNDLLNKNKRKKNTITVSIEQVIKLAKERMGKQRTHNTTFYNMIKYEVGESGQKIFERIFQLALERYAQLQHEGKMPTLISHRIPTQKPKPTPRPAPRPRPTPTPRPESQPIETEQPIEKRITTDLDKIKALVFAKIPKGLHEHLKIESDTEKPNILITIMKRIPTEEWNKVFQITNNYQGTYKYMVFKIPLPLEVRTTSDR